MAYEFHGCKITDVQQLSEHVRSFKIHVPESKVFSFKPGQFVMLHLPIEKSFANRAYTIASAPTSDNNFELVISLKPKGKGTHFLWDHTLPGSEILVSRNALGKFLLPEIIDRDLCFICTGTGIAPFRSMLNHIFQKNIPHKKITLIFGNRFVQDILYRTEFENMEKAHPEFTFIPVLSRENPEWKGRNGYVHAVYMDIFKHKPDMYFYICGWSEMTREARQHLLEMGYEKNYIRFERYD